MSPTAESVLNLLADQGPRDTEGLVAAYRPTSPEIIRETARWLYRHGYTDHGTYAWFLTPAGREAIGR